VELVDIVDGWLWHKGKIDNMPEVVFGWFGRLLVKKRRIRCIVGSEGSIA
jgi:hypothetical protein